MLHGSTDEDATDHVYGLSCWNSICSTTHFWDVDGNEYIDYVLSWGPMIVGHAHPAVTAALKKAVADGTSFGAPTDLEIILAKMVKKAVEEGYPTNITLNDLVCFAVIRALKKYPQVNSHFLDDSMKYFKKVHLGVAFKSENMSCYPVKEPAVMRDNNRAPREILQSFLDCSQCIDIYIVRRLV